MDPLVTYLITLISLLLLRHLLTLLYHSLHNAHISRTNHCRPPLTSQLHPPFPFSLLPIRAFLHAFSENRHINLINHQFTLHGPTRIYTSLLSPAITVATSSPSNIRAILASPAMFTVAPGRMAAFGPLLGKGVFTSDGAVWEHSRVLLRPLFSRERVADLGDVECATGHLLEQLAPQQGEEVGLGVLLGELAMQVAVGSLWGVEGGEEELEQFGKDWEYCTERLSFRLGVWDYRWLYWPRGLSAAIARVHGVVDDVIGRAIATQDQRTIDSPARTPPLLHTLLTSTPRLKPKQIRAHILNTLLASNDTTTSLLSWTFYLLSRHPEVYTHLRTSILTTIGHSPPTAPQLSQLPYLRWVLCETLRLYPPLPMNFRTAAHACTLPDGGGADGTSPILVPTGSKIVYCVYSMHRRKGLWGSDAGVFRPERWGEEGAGEAVGRWIPFNGGGRKCMGQQMAMVTVGYVVVRVLQRFAKMEAVVEEGRRVRSVLGVTLRPADGVRVRMWGKENVGVDGVGEGE